MRLSGHENPADLHATPIHVHPPMRATQPGETEAELPKLAPVAVPSTASASGCAGARILLLSQDPRSRDQFNRVGQETRAGVVIADNAESAIRLLARQPFDVAVIDTGLRSGGGGDLLELIRQRWGWVQMVLLGSVAEDQQTPRSAARLGVSEWLTKPCSQREIVATLTRACRRRAQDNGAAGSIAISTATAATAQTASSPASIDPANVDRPVLTHILGGTLEYVERVHILAALDRHQGNRESAANELGISVRKLYYRLRQYHREGHANH